MTGTGHYNSLLVTGGAGFIGSAFVRRAIGAGMNVAVLDNMTYAGRTENLASVLDNPRCGFIVGDICDPLIVEEIFSKFRPEAVIHFAAESHVDRSIEDPAVFIETNVHGTQVMLDAALRFFGGLSGDVRDRFRFVHISTDEVFGSLGPSGAFDEETAYAPRSPYSASKAAADHLVLAWQATYGLPVSILHASNNYGPRQFPEKFIPNMIVSAIRGRPLTVYGDGGHVRDWLHVDDTCAAVDAAVRRGATGQRYCIGGQSERTNLQVATAIADILDTMSPAPSGRRYRDAIVYVPDRPGHDRRYATSIARASRELGWCPARAFETGLRETVAWYLENEFWWRPLLAEDDATQRRGLERRR